jgi:hypothetical protein
MHQLNVLALGPDSFIATLNELKSYLKFNFSSDISKLNNNSKQNFSFLLFHIKILENQKIKNIIDKSDLTKVLLLDDNIKLHNYDISLKLPTTLKEINSIVENSAARKIFSSNSCIKIKDFLLDKNEKKLIKGDNFIILT